MASTSNIHITPDRVYKTPTLYLEYDIIQREVFWLKKLSNSGVTPKFIQIKDSTLEMENVGAPLISYSDFINKNFHNIPPIPEDWENQIKNILNILDKYNCSHNDIKPWDICIKGKKIYLIDFQWATFKNEPFPPHFPDVGGDFKPNPHEFDDKFSIYKSFNMAIDIIKNSSKKQDIVLYCKSYHGDIDRVVNLFKSINQFNSDNIPLYVSCPSSDLKLFKSKLGSKGYTLIRDEDIIISNLKEGHKSQQVIKSNFWKLGLCENYVCLDSDSLFIKPFFKSDFLFKDNIPYTLCHQQKQLFEWAVNKLPFDPIDGFKQDRQKAMDIFNRKGAHYDFGPSPVIWSSKVWEYLEDIYIKPNDLHFDDLIQLTSEFSWYGEALLSMGFPLYPLEPLFKVYHYREQYTEDKQRGTTLSDISKNYLGIILQSNWGAPLNY